MSPKGVVEDRVHNMIRGGHDPSRSGQFRNKYKNLYGVGLDGRSLRFYANSYPKPKQEPVEFLSYEQISLLRDVSQAIEIMGGPNDAFGVIDTIRKIGGLDKFEHAVLAIRAITVQEFDLPKSSEV